MTRPTIIRADTLDLQDHESPSAKDHHSGLNISQNSHDIAPSQANAIMNVANEQAHEQHDLRIATNGIDSIGRPGDIRTTGSTMNSHHEDMTSTDEDEEDEDDEDMLDKMSSSPSISDEDIDFEFVYALHTFIATVEGQANATKGDTMVLLDDSNSYWWLVRVVKDSSIGYLPAEHIETPSERLARLNKHRNVDLSTPMLGDNPEKSKNPLRKAIKRRNAKTVTFGQSSFHEASEIEWSSEGEGEFDSNDDDDGVGLDDDEEEDAAVETAQAANTKLVDTDSITSITSQITQSNQLRTSSESSEKKQLQPQNPRTSDDAMSVDSDNQSRKSTTTLKTPDASVFDGNQPPKRMILTPQLLRDESNNSVTTSMASIAPVKSKTSLDKIDRSNKREDSPPPAGKEKDKKPKKSMLGNFFKKRSKKPSREDEMEDFLHYEKRSSESLRDEQRTKIDNKDIVKRQDPIEVQTTQSVDSRQQPQNPAQLQQQQGPQTVKSFQQKEHGQVQPAQQSQMYMQQQNQQPYQSQPAQSELPLQLQAGQPQPTITTRTTTPPPMESTNVIRVSPQKQSQPSTIRTIRAIEAEPNANEKYRNYGSADDRWQYQNRDTNSNTDYSRTTSVSPTKIYNSQLEKSHIQIIPVTNIHADQPVSPISQTPLSRAITAHLQGPSSNMIGPMTSATHRYTDSPEELIDEPPPLIVDTSSSSEENNLPEVSPVDSHIDLRQGPRIDNASTPISVNHPWSDASLRSYFEEDNSDIRDFLVLVNDKSNMVPVKSHPAIVPLFAEANSTLKNLTSRLDGMLSTYLQGRSNQKPSSSSLTTNA